MATFLTSYDVILSTTLAGPPPKLGYFDQNGDVQSFAERVTEYLSVTPLHNATGTLAMNVPLHWTADGLPVGVHFEAATVRRRPCSRLPPNWRPRNRGSIACRRSEERAGTHHLLREVVADDHRVDVGPEPSSPLPRRRRKPDLPAMITRACAVPDRGAALRPRPNPWSRYPEPRRGSATAVRAFREGTLWSLSTS
jgi:Amidase